jgi:hypothetical protein
MTAAVVADHAKALRQIVLDERPRLPAGPASVNENQGLAATGLLHRQPNAVDLEVRHGQEPNFPRTLGSSDHGLPGGDCRDYGRRVDVGDYRRASREVWEAMAQGWEHRRAQLAEALLPVREWLIRRLAAQPGEVVLELGAGPGDTGFAAAAMVGESGRLISSDFSDEMRWLAAAEASWA